jgi:hypothetical protein
MPVNFKTKIMDMNFLENNSSLKFGAFTKKNKKSKQYVKPNSINDYFIQLCKFNAIVKAIKNTSL